jgi:phosphate-selective porin OprO and OprP
MRKSILVAGLLLLSPAISCPATSHAKTLDELLVEKGIITKGEAASASSGAAGSVSWKDGNRFSYPSEGVTAKVTTLLQERYTFTDNDEDSGEGNTSSFDTKRARIIVHGSALNEEFAYELETDFAEEEHGHEGDKSPALLNAAIEWKACDWAVFKMGQFKTGVSRQWNTDPAKLQFVNRTLVSDYMDLGRQQGLSATGNIADGQIELSAGVFNGESDGEGQNHSGNDTDHTGIVSARWNAVGKLDPSAEGDIDYTEDAALSVGAVYAHSAGNNAVGTSTVLEDTDKDTINADLSFKYQGWSAAAEYYYQSQDADSYADSVDVNGFYVQVGYFLDPKVLEVAARYGLLDCDSGQGIGVCSGNDQINEVDATVNYYFWKHNLKAQLGYELINEDPIGAGTSGINTNRWIFQLSAYL